MVKLGARVATAYGYRMRGVIIARDWDGRQVTYDVKLDGFDTEVVAGTRHALSLNPTPEFDIEMVEITEERMA